MNKGQAFVFQVVKLFAAQRFHKEAYITGGFPRDLHFGFKAADIDITIPVGDIEPEDAFDVGVKLCGILASSGCTTSISQAYGQAVGDFNERIHCLIQATLPDGEEVDIMLHRADDLDGVFETYDSNINQVYLDHYGAPVWYAGHAPTECRALKQLTPERIERLHHIALAYGLPVVEESFAVRDYGDDKCAFM